MLAHQLMPVFGMDEEEYSVRNGKIDGSPDSLRFNRLVTPFRVAVYDVTILPRPREGIMKLRFRLHKGLVLAIAVWFIDGLLIGSMWKWESFILPVGALLLFNGLGALFISASKSSAESIVKRWGKSEE